MNEADGSKGMPERYHEPGEWDTRRYHAAGWPGVLPACQVVSVVWPYLQRYRCVLQAVDPEAVLQGGAEGWGEDGQLEPLDCRAGIGLTREHVGAQLV